MLVVFDECVSDAAVSAVAADGAFDVVCIGEISPRAEDSRVLEFASTSGALFVTSDKDFRELVVRRGAASNGVLLCRLGSYTLAEEAEAVLATLRAQGESLLGAFSVLSPNGLRTRPLRGQAADPEQQA